MWFGFCLKLGDIISTVKIGGFTYIHLLLIGIPLFLFTGTSCKKTTTDEAVKTGRITLLFNHYNDGSPLIRDTMVYTNDAGNRYLVNEIQYFISDVTLHYQDGREVMIDAWKDIHYVDTDIPSTQQWNVYDELPAGMVKHVSFTFGISEEKNQSLMYTDPPESLMFWPEYLGGGYHYLKLNGKWLAADGMVKPFNFHLGIGQIYNGDGDITGFIQNYFKVTIQESPFEISEGSSTSLEVRMNVANWFRGPNVYDHDDWGGDIMQKQEAMKLGCENGWDVFSMEIIKPDR